MSRPKIPEKEQLSRIIRVRVKGEVYERLSTLQKQTDCRSICELARRILSKEKIVFFSRDVSMNGPMEELSLIRKELKAIGININQQTHYFHRSQSAPERPFYLKQTAGFYQKVDFRVERLLAMVNELSLKWLQR